jgi:hypothetical protein
MKNNVIFNFYTGRPSKVVTDVSRRISAYTREDRVRSFKIGITNHPERRFREAYSTNYDKMIVIYKSKSINSVSTLETQLIEYNIDFTDNIIAGGGGNIGKPPYYLYVAIALKH